MQKGKPFQPKSFNMKICQIFSPRCSQYPFIRNSGERSHSDNVGEGEAVNNHPTESPVRKWEFLSFLFFLVLLYRLRSRRQVKAYFDCLSNLGDLHALSDLSGILLTHGGYVTNGATLSSFQVNQLNFWWIWSSLYQR